jgi:hypothetical protein
VEPSTSARRFDEQTVRVARQRSLREFPPQAANELNAVAGEDDHIRQTLDV